MRLNDVFHVIRAAHGSTGAKRFFIIGSQSILGAYPDAPKSLTASFEVDLAFSDYQLAIEVDGSLGELSPFHDTHGYFGHGVTEDAAILPKDWKSRKKIIAHPELHDVEITFLHPHDAVYSKLAAGREKDFEWAKEIFRLRLANQGQVAQLITQCDDPDLREKLERNFLIATGKKVDDFPG